MIETTTEATTDQHQVPAIVLKPCPFCGSEAESEVIPSHQHSIATFMPDAGDTCTVECSKCAAGFVGSSREEVAAKWNARHLCSLELAVVVGRGLENMGSNPSPAKVRDLLIELQTWAMHE